MIPVPEIEVEVGAGLRRVRREVRREFEDTQTTLGALMDERWHRNVFKVKGGPRNKIAYKTGAYEAEIRLQPMQAAGDISIRDVLSNIGYGDVIEQGIPGTAYTPRPIAKITVEESERDIERELNRTGKRIEQRMK